MNISRRRFGQLLLGGTSLAAIATGLSPSFLRAPLAWAEEADDGCADDRRFLIVSVNSAGDPINANCPGAYELPGIVHPAHADFAATPLQLGSTSTTAARVWTGVPQWVLDRTTFIHHATRTVVHPDTPKVLSLLGAAKDNEQVPTLIARQLASCLGTIQSLPVSVGVDPLSSRGVVLQRLQPTALRRLFVNDHSPLLGLRSLRDQQVDRMHAILKRNGTSEQKRYLDARVRAQADVRKLNDDASSLFGGILNNGQENQVRAAVGLIRLGITPVVAVSLGFGTDNHIDDDLAIEIKDHSYGVAALTSLMQLLKANALEDRVTFALMNVFGRTLARDGLRGRNHWPHHAISMIIGKGVRGSVVGGMAPLDDDFTSTGIDSASGHAMLQGGDIPYEESLSAVGKTISRAVGVEEAVIEEWVTGGKIIRAVFG